MFSVKMSSSKTTYYSLPCSPSIACRDQSSKDHMHLGSVASEPFSRDIVPDSISYKISPNELTFVSINTEEFVNG